MEPFLRFCEADEKRTENGVVVLNLWFAVENKDWLANNVPNSQQLRTNFVYTLWR